MTDDIPAGVPPESAEAARATLGGAVAEAEQLPDPLGAELLDVAREAFAQGLQVSAAMAAVITAAAAVAAAVLLRHVRSGAVTSASTVTATAD